MNKSNYTNSDNSMKEINHIFHPLADGTFYIDHSCFSVENHIVVPNRIYLLFDCLEDLISSIIPFKLEDILIVKGFIMIVGIDILSGEELGRNEYLIDNAGCAFKLMDFDYLKAIMNRIEVKTVSEKE